MMEIGISSETAGEGELNDNGNNFVRPLLVTAQGANLPPVFGGPPKQVKVDIDLCALQSKGLSPIDVSTAISAAEHRAARRHAEDGNARVSGRTELEPPEVLSHARRLSDPDGQRPNGLSSGTWPTMRLGRGRAERTSSASTAGAAAYIGVLKFGAASTISVVNRIRSLLPLVQEAIPRGSTSRSCEDQSVYVRNAISGVIREGGDRRPASPACMILLFLGSWRSTVIVAVSIPLSILSSVVVLWALGQTINSSRWAVWRWPSAFSSTTRPSRSRTCTATWRRAKTCSRRSSTPPHRSPYRPSSRRCRSASCSSRFSSSSGASASLFRPLALAVIFAVLASYLLSRTLVPTMVRYMLGGELADLSGHRRGAGREAATRELALAHQRVRRGRLRSVSDRYVSLLRLALDHKVVTLGTGAAFIGLSMLLIPAIGEDFFPAVDAGVFQLHVRAPSWHTPRGKRIGVRRRRADDPPAHPRGGDSAPAGQHRARRGRRGARNW